MRQVKIGATGRASLVVSQSQTVANWTFWQRQL